MEMTSVNIIFRGMTRVYRNVDLGWRPSLDCGSGGVAEQDLRRVVFIGLVLTVGWVMPNDR
jgi:hypothetical protein